jgi:hypothetical protein
LTTLKDEENLKLTSHTYADEYLGDCEHEMRGIDRVVRVIGVVAELNELGILENEKRGRAIRKQSKDYV